MFTYFRLLIALRKANNELKSLESTFSPLIREAQESGNSKKTEDLTYELRHHLSEWRDEKALLRSRFWRQQAIFHGLTIPSQSEEGMWDNSKWFRENYLTDVARAEIVKAWWDRLGKYSTVLGGVCGVTGLMISLLALSRS